jgi:hypothetical protein
MTTDTDFEIIVRRRNTARHPHQKAFIESKKKLRIIKAGRRGGKTIGVAQVAVDAFIHGKRVLYTAPTSEQTDAFWYEIHRAFPNLDEAVRKGKLKVNEQERYIEVPGTKRRLRAKTAWNANTMRGDYADILIFDEFQLTAEDAWEQVGAPMLADNNGDALFIFTPPSLQTSGISKAKDPRHASKFFKQAEKDIAEKGDESDWAVFHFTSLDNPFISREGLARAAQNMSLDAYRREIMAEDDEIELSWLVYGKFNENVCKIPRFKIPENWPVYSGHDFGSANPAALFLAQVRLPLPQGAPEYMRYNDLVAFREYCPGGGFSSTQHRDRFVEMVKGYDVKKRVGGSHQEDGWRGEMTLLGWPILEPIMKQVGPQVDRVISLMEQNKLYVFNDLHGLLAEISNCLWELDEENKPINKIDNEQRYHLLAALRYIGSEFSPEMGGVGIKIQRQKRN